MEEKNNKHLKLLLFLAIITLCIAIIAIAILFVSKGALCLSNPLVFGAKDLSYKANTSLSCDCKFSDPSFKAFYFNEKELKEKKLPYEYPFLE